MGRVYIVIAVIILLLNGCSDKGVQKSFKLLKSNNTRYSTLKNSEKVVFAQGSEDEVVVLLNYLPNKNDKSNSNRQKYERFVISLYPENSDILKSLKISSKKPVYTQKVSHSSLPSAVREFVPKWFNSYMVKFPKIDKKKFTLTLSMPKYGSRKVVFYKITRYRIDKPKYWKNSFGYK